ncbi:hypothetical protein L2Y94_13270 [Luteibacter aegosomatis]|uniref:hypothetical protein n=1 Tax=Luteibacter aegosomatis TaxID=2911537 RepID=UPI001FF9640D|nr:hypothetical protein [Luteibacter aegosomatis]UPG84311.1 hypothetical protein L2Y94_13270 [Luteibacter aegosomatis]
MTPGPHLPNGLPADALALLAQAAEARNAMDKAARDTALAADELRRYAKFSRPGQPSAHIVQLRQKQATARIESARSRQAFLVAANGFVHASGLAVPKGMSLEAYVLEWIRRSAEDITGRK